MKITYTCLYCGKSGETSWVNKRYCDSVCRARYRENVRQPHAVYIPCQYNAGVDCSGGNCFKCGWNPEVEQKRREKMGV